MYEPTREQNIVAEDLATDWGQSVTSRFPGSENIVVRGVCDGETMETLVVTPDGVRERAATVETRGGGLVHVLDVGTRTVVPDSVTTDVRNAQDQADQLNADHC